MAGATAEHLIVAVLVHLDKSVLTCVYADGEYGHEVIPPPEETPAGNGLFGIGFKWGYGRNRADSIAARTGRKARFGNTPSGPAWVIE